MNSWLAKQWKENKSVLVFLGLMLVFRSAIADWNEVPTGSMNPTIVEGDRIFVNKMAYDLRVPFTHISLKKISDPERGDIVIFDSKVSDKRLVKRVIGLPGDIVEMNNNQLVVNGEALNYQPLASGDAFIDKIESLNNIEYVVRTQKEESKFSSFSSVTVPEDKYLVLGDNRDNSADSRFIGFVPRDEIVGRSKMVVLSFDYEKFYMPRSDRFFKAI